MAEGDASDQAELSATVEELNRNLDDLNGSSSSGLHDINLQAESEPFLESKSKKKSLKLSKQKENSKT